jgi:hypothetical protein
MADEEPYSVESVRNKYALKRSRAETLGWGLGVVTFIGSWIYCTSKYGYLFGFGLGWLPSIILGGIVGLLVFAMADQ